MQIIATRFCGSIYRSRGSWPTNTPSERQWAIGSKRFGSSTWHFGSIGGGDRRTIPRLTTPCAACPVQSGFSFNVGCAAGALCPCRLLLFSALRESLHWLGKRWLWYNSVIHQEGAIHPWQRHNIVPKR